MAKRKNKKNQQALKGLVVVIIIAIITILGDKIKLDNINNLVEEVSSNNVATNQVVADSSEAVDGEDVDVYYLDVAENYRLCRYSLSQNVVEVLTNERVDCFNVGNGFIYYQTNGNEPALKCMRADGSNVQTIAQGIYTAINMTSQYVYFKEFGNEINMYHSYLGSSTYEEFIAARNAAMEK